MAGTCPTCPASCVDNTGCTLTEFCLKADGVCGGLGVCTARPDLCPDDCPQVCGCNGVVYCNACMANAAGAPLGAPALCPRARCAPMRVGETSSGTRHRAFWDGDQCRPFGGDCRGLDCDALFSSVPECESMMETCACGGIRGLPCGGDEYCEHSSSCCDADAAGICRPRPTLEACEAAPDMPVTACGEGLSFRTACEAHAMGFDVPPTGVICAGIGMP